MTTKSIDAKRLYEWWQNTGQGKREFYRANAERLNELGVPSANALIGKTWRYEKKLTAMSEIEALTVPSYKRPNPLAWDNCIIVGDVHAPTTDIEIWTRMLMIAQRYLPKPRRLIIAGDLYNMDGFSSYDPTHTSPNLAQELNVGRALVADALRVFDRVHMIAGNHERRITKQTKAQISMALLRDLTSHNRRFTMSHYGWCIVRSGGETYRATHARNYSVQQLNVADALAQKYQSHIIQHHEHHVAKGWDRFKRFVVINNGGIFNRDALLYTFEDDSKNAAMTPGFTLLRNGYADVFGLWPYTDWRRWLD